jgi:hypothetical protein
LNAIKKPDPNGVNVIEVDYESVTDTGSKFYRTAMTIDLKKYEFKEVSFTEIQKNDVRKSKTVAVSSQKTNDPIDTSKCIGTITTNKDYTEKLLDLAEPINLKMIQVIDLIARGSSSAFKKIVSVKVITY